MVNRAERRRLEREKSKPQSSKAEYSWRTIFDAKPMADGMPPSFLLYLLNEKEGFARMGKLLTASLWLQSQMVSVICLQDSPELRQRCTIDNGRHLPNELLHATTKGLEELSSESLRTAFLQQFRSEMTEELQRDLERVSLGRDALAHGYVSLFRQISEKASIPWSPRPSRERNEVLDRLAGPRPTDTFFSLSLSDPDFEEEISRICRVMDFIASTVKKWDIPYAVFA